MPGPTSEANRPLTSAPFLPRRLAASAVDVALMFATAALWWHWSEWAHYTGTFGRRWPWTVAMPVMTLVPVTLMWLEAVSGRGAGKGVTGLRVASAAGGRAGLGRRLARAALKWSPVWVGPAVWIADAYTAGSRADDFTNDHLLPAVNAWADAAATARPLVWTLGVMLRGINWGVWLLAALAVGQAAVLLPGRRSLLDRLCGTRVVRRT
ncbi:MAG: hypothetical protein JWO31_3504 [Phycisphaerales bacterium]|nr:hypothetical protein [Phycisphaerales bacterium]